jgi:hypothetical protein
MAADPASSLALYTLAMRAATQPVKMDKPPMRETERLWTLCEPADAISPENRW